MNEWMGFEIFWVSDKVDERTFEWEDDCGGEGLQCGTLGVRERLGGRARMGRGLDGWVGWLGTEVNSMLRRCPNISRCLQSVIWPRVTGCI